MTADKVHPKETIVETSSAANAVQVQCSLAIGAVNDPLEHEADAMADKVMSMQEVPAVTSANAGGIQRKCAGCEEEEKVQRKPLASFIQRKESSAVTIASDAVSSQIHASRGNGSTMDSNTQSFMQSRFGTDFSDVKIHTGGEAIQMNRELNAKAFTVGNDIYFNEGQYNPGSGDGKHLLAHELTHTVQQGGVKKLKKKASLEKKDEEERLYNPLIHSPFIQRAVTNIAVAGATPEVAQPNDFVVNRGGGNVILTATTSAPGLAVTWSGGRAVSGNPLQRLVRPNSAGTTTITADTPANPGYQTATIHTINSRPLPANTAAVLGFSKNAGIPAGLAPFGLTDVREENPTLRIEAFLNGNAWNFRVLRIHHRYKIGITGGGNTDIPNARSRNIPINFCPLITDLTPASLTTPPPRANFWSRPITQMHEECHVNRFYSPPFWEAFMRVAETTVEAAAMNVAVDHTIPNTMTAAAVLAANLPAIQGVFDAQHAAADAAEIGTSEAVCHAQSNARYNTLIAEIAAQHRPVAPTGLVAVAGGPASVTLTWVDNACNETEYRVYRRRGRGPFTAINFLPAGTVTFTDTTAGLTTATPYTYKVVAVGTTGESSPSNLVNITTP